MASLMDEIKDSFRKGNAMVKLIYINLAVFLAVNIIFLIYVLVTPSTGFPKRLIFQDRFLNYLMVHTDLKILITRPWTIFTYMFLHFDFLHILFNLLWLFWFGRIFLHYLTNKQLYSTYILGGISGAFLLILSYNVFPGLEMHLPALGASASITAVIISISFYAPDYSVYIPILGPVKIKYIALVYIFLDILMIVDTGAENGLNQNAGGHIAHLGGAIYGYLFAMQLKRGKDIGKGFSRIADSIAVFFRQRPKMQVSYKSYKKQAKYMDDQQYNRSKAETQKEIDRILDKIAKSGYESLTKAEKETLFKMSNRS
jgi:membrane associated rhomboid family serine protease